MSDPRTTQRPRYTVEDFKTITSKIRYDLTSAQAKLTDLMRMVATIDLPTEDQPYSLERGEAYVTTVGYLYTDASLTDDLLERGADKDHVPLLLAVAAKRREQVQGERDANWSPPVVETNASIDFERDVRR